MIHTLTNPPGASRRLLHRATRWLAPGVAALALAACASLGGGAAQQQVSQRANERWQALVAGEFSRAYGYTTPAFRAVVTPDAYRSRIGSAVKWVGAETVKVECPEPATCTATVRLDYRPVLGAAGGATFSTHITETWLLEAGQWWLFQPIKG